MIVIVAAFLATEVFDQAQKLITGDNSRQAAAYAVERAGLADVRRDPYAGLAVAAMLGGSEADRNAEVVTSALKDPVPDDAVRVPAVAVRFVAGQGGEIVVASRTGKEWGRSSSAMESRDAHPVPSLHLYPTSKKGSALTARRDGDTGTVSIFFERRLWRRITFGGPVEATSFSPDARNLAASFGSLVEVADVRAGIVRTVLRGAPGRILDVEWSADGRRVWALTKGMAVSWLTGVGKTLIDDPHSEFEALLPSSRPGAAWIVSSNGNMTEFAIGNGTVIARRHIDDQINTAAGSADGKFAAVSGQRREWIVPLASAGASRSFSVPGCIRNRPAFLDDVTFYLPCSGGDLLRISVTTGTVTRRINVGPGGVFTARVIPGNDTILAGDDTGHLYALSPAGSVMLERSQCNGSIDRISIAPKGQAVIPVGSGTGFLTCTSVGLRSGPDPANPSDWRWNHFFDATASFLAETATFSNDGRTFAVGYSDGTIIEHPTKNITPALAITSVDGPIRDMLATSDGHLLIATYAGIVQQIPFCGGCISDRALAKVAAARLSLAVKLGLTRRAD